jgi:hypothetical protein
MELQIDEEASWLSFFPPLGNLCLQIQRALDPLEEERESAEKKFLQFPSPPTVLSDFLSSSVW